ncbi:MAG: SDR family NAD(P)-dependent oxidoreductase [Cyanobacteria bacterium J06638_22]
MSRNRRQFLGAVGATGVVGAIGAKRVMAQNTDSSTPTPLAQTTPTNRELTGKAAIVTGARANIGRAIAVELARMGSNVVIHYHRPETRDQAEQTAAMCQEYGVNTALAVSDLGQKDNVMRMFDVATDTFGRLDIFVHNAGALVKGPVAWIIQEK